MWPGTTASALSYAAMASDTAPIWCMIRPDCVDANTRPLPPSGLCLKLDSISTARRYALSAALCLLRAS